MEPLEPWLDLPLGKSHNECTQSLISTMPGVYAGGFPEFPEFPETSLRVKDLRAPCARGYEVRG